MSPQLAIRQAMFSWIFKKKAPASPATTVVAAQVSAQAAAQAAQSAAASKQAHQAAAAVWLDRVSRAHGNDEALLALAKEAPTVDAKVAAVSALTQEASLKQAEREFRTHDRRVHQVAKRRHAEVKAQRETTERAAGLIQTATDLLAAPEIPVNRLAELERHWKALDAALVSAALQAGFEAALAQLKTALHVRSEHKLAVARWAELATQTTTQLRAQSLAAACGEAAGSELARACDAAQGVLADMPAGDPSAALGAALQSTLSTAALVQARLAFLDQLKEISLAPAQPCADQADTVMAAEVDGAIHAAEGAADVKPAAQPVAQTTAEIKPEPTAEHQGAPAAADAADLALVAALSEAAPSEAAPSAAAQWNALPRIGDTELARALSLRFDAWQREQAPRPAPRAEKRPAPKEKLQRVPVDRTADIDPLLLAAEAALADGQMAQAHQHLMALEDMAPMDATQRTRLNFIQGEVARMKGWQQWSGGRAREDVVAESEALAFAANSAAEAGEPLADLRAHGAAIDELRQRWRELDRLKAATSQPLWERFDAALKTAFAPVAAHLAQLDVERQTNLASRQALLDALDAALLPGAIAADQSAATEPTSWKDVIRALDQFHTAWRKLGPAEHTTPRKAQKALLERMNASLARLESPLKEARRKAQSQREALVTRAKALNPDAKGAEVVAQVRELQAQWQEHARTLPLARAIETALWAEFKAATDAVFAQREAAFSARDAEFKANEAAIVALAERLEALPADAPVADIKRTLAEVDAAWRQIGEATRANGAAVDARFRRARAQAQNFVAGHAQRVWHTTCDALLSKLSLCETLEETQGEPDVDSRWAALPPLPPLWEQALRQRKQAATQAPQSSDADKDKADATLLALEVMLDLPSPAEQQDARRQLKLRAMKSALEGGPSQGTASLDQLTVEVLSNRHLSAVQRQRLNQLIAGLRAGEPRTVG